MFRPKSRLGIRGSLESAEEVRNGCNYSRYHRVFLGFHGVRHASALSTGLPFVWDAWLGEHRLIDATGLGTWGGAAVGFVAVQVFMYAWHRSMHNNDFLWRWFHQMHHSAERIDVAGTFYFSPLDMVGWTFLGSLALVWAVGVTPEAAVLVTLATTFMAMFTHANIRTPRWLGYFLARPEMHAIHHERGAHSGNYCDLPIIDMAFGTYKNPDTFDGQAGFYDGASSRVVDMMLGRDVSEPTQHSVLSTQVSVLRGSELRTGN
jgi:sterol desaturase/sphingolipid hydroxylase (fatty acid hydroxylase superfamily)